MTLGSIIAFIALLIWLWLIIFKFNVFDKIAIIILKKKKVGRIGKFFLSRTFFKIAYVFLVFMILFAMFASTQ